MGIERLPAKLSRPRLHGVIDRERLFERLDAESERPVTWVMGPPGAGKTTLVTTYLSQRRIATLWFRVDEGDADAATFFSYLTQAAKTLKRKSAQTLPPLTPEYLLDLPGFIRRYFRQLFSAFPDTGALVLDSFEVGAGGMLEQLLGIAAAEVPPGVRIIVTSRTEPPEALAHLVTSGSLGLVAWQDLRLSKREARAIAAGENDNESVDTVYAMSDGWAAGFVVMINHARRTGLPDSRAAGLAREALFSYFIKELFADIDDSTREFLMRTAVMPGFSVAEAVKLCPDVDAQVLLSRLYRRHFFTDRSGDAAPTYHYHALFKEFLLEQGRARYPLLQRALLLTHAGQLLEGGGRIEDAIAAYTEAGNWPEAGRLLCQIAPMLLRQGRNTVLDRSIGALPAQMVEQVPWLSFWLGAARLPFSPPVGRSLFESAFAQFEAAGDATASLLACSGILQSYWFEWNDMRPVGRWGKAFLALIRRGDVTLPPDLEAQVIESLFGVLFVAEDHPELVDWAYQRAVERIWETRDSLQRARLANFASWIGFARGDHRLWRQLVATVDSQLVRADLPPLQIALWELLKAWQHYQTGEFDDAFAALEICDSQLETNGVLIVSILVNHHFALAALNSGDLARAKRHVAKMGTVLNPARVLDGANYDITRCILALAQGDAPAAIEFGRASVAKATACGTSMLTAESRTGLAYALLEGGDNAAALEVAEKVAAYGRDAKHRAFEHAGLMIMAGVLLRAGQGNAAREVLVRALAMGKADDFVLVFPWSPTGFLQEVYGSALDWGLEVAYVTNVIRRLKIPAAPGASDLWPRPIKVFTLGRFDVLIDEAPLEFGRKAPKRPLALLKFLIAQRGQASAETAIDALWPDEEADAAANALDAALHRLRKLLGDPDRLTLQDGILRLDRSSIWVDAFAFEQSLDMAENAIDGARALRRYQGHFLAADRAEPWSISARERLRSRFIRAAAARGETLEAEREFANAATHYARVIDIDDLIEAPYQGLMRCQLALGQRSEGIATYERLRRTLAAGLGLKPTPASEALHKALRSG